MTTARSTQHHANLRRLRNVDHTADRRPLAEPAPNDKPRRYADLVRLKIAVRELRGAKDREGDPWR